MKNSSLMRLDNASKIYLMGEQEVVALNNISLKINKKDLLVIVGPSGSGKSTLLHILGLLDRPSSGRAFVKSQDISSLSDDELAGLRNRTIGFVFQQFNLLARTTVLDNVLLPAVYNANLAQQEAEVRAKKILSRVGLSKRLDHKPNELSGGQQQRVAIARSLICNPEIILADEPTGNLDSKTGKKIIELLVSLQKEDGKTLIFVTHDYKLTAIGKRKIFLKDGSIRKEE